ncbi:MAG: cyclic nucleotide-binding domain-containing protein [Anaerolineales bacterium]|nr:cyclic nucleotide-binding domain-containing protein [Anaerolineales bacterium]
MAHSEPVEKFLSHVPLFSGLHDRQLKQLSRRFVTRSYQPNEYVVSQGKGGAGMFVIVSGHAEAVLESRDGDKTVVNTFGPSDFFGEIALLDDGPRTASVVATEETECLILSRPDFIAVMQNDAEMGVIIAQELANRIRKLINSFGSK